MRVLILYFSGTGNTNYVARYLEKKLACFSVITDLISIEKFSPKECIDYDIMIIGFPVYAGAPPDFLRHYLDKLPTVYKKGIFLFCTRAMFTGQAINDVHKKLENKGYILLGISIIAMPGSDALPFMKRNSRYVRKALNRDYSNIKKINKFAHGIAFVIGEINRGKSIDSMRMRAPQRIPLISNLLQLLWAYLYKLAEKKIKPMFWVDDKCVQCKLCVEQCPSKNISLINNAISFGTHCYMCMRCINQCPKEAIQIGKGTVNKFRWKGPNGKFKPNI